MTLSDGREVLRLFHLVARTPQSYRFLVICTPFISEALIKSFLKYKRALSVPILIITHPDTSYNLSKGSQYNLAKFAIAPIPNLHAKVYLACGKDDRDSVAIIGSFNLTIHALETNIELGVRISGKTPETRQLITSLEKKLMAIANLKVHGEKL